MERLAFVLLGTFLLLNMAQSNDMFMEKMTNCAKDMGISADQMKEMMGKHDGKMGCIHACVMKNMGGMSEDGKLDKEKLLEKLIEHKDSIENFSKVESEFNNCYDSATSGGDQSDCQVAAKFADCVHKNMQG